MTSDLPVTPLSPSSGKQRLLLIDASPYIFRSYFALPSSLRTPNGAPINAAHGFASFLIKLFSEELPSHVAVAFDGSLTTSFRNEIYPEYKANRELPPVDLVDQLECCRAVASALGTVTAISDRFEADDLIGSWLAQLGSLTPDVQVSIVTSDKDLAQLIEPSIDLYDFARGDRWTADTVRRKFGVRPSQLADFLSLAGDSVDNIPGVPGIGPKTAALLLVEFEDLASLLENLDRVSDLEIRGAKSIQKKLQKHAESARVSLQLARIATDATIETDLESLRWRGPTNQWPILCRKLGFGSLLERGANLHR